MSAVSMHAPAAVSTHVVVPCMQYPGSILEAGISSLQP